MSQHPYMILTYSPSGFGKTVDCGYSFPRALFLGMPQNLQSIKSVCGYTPATMDIKTIQEATQVIREAKDKGFDSIVVDDFSHLAEMTFVGLERIKDNRMKYAKLREITIEFRNAARYAGMHVIMNAWEQPPKTGTGTFVRGGPMLSGKLPEQLPAICDLVLRAGREPKRKPWSGVYQCEHSNEYIMKDLFNVCYHMHPCPMNLAEILRACGVEIQRMEGLEWQEQVIEDFIVELEQANDFTTTVETLFGRLLEQQIDPKYARWTIRDTLDRLVIRRALSNHRQSYFA